MFLGADNSVKLGDFGLSKLMQSHDFASTYVGTPFYMSPEICAAERYTSYSDIWSLGCIMYELCARKPPFNAKTHFHLVHKIKEGRVDPLPSIYSQDLQNVIKSCLKTNPLHRPDTEQLLNLPMIRLMRKEREVIELGKILRTSEELARQKIEEANAKAAGVDKESEKIRSDIEATVRREWEVKARLEIDRQVKIEMEKLNKKFETEVQSRVEKGMQTYLESVNASKQEHSASPTDIQYSSVSTSADTDFRSSTDLSSLSLDSPPVEKPTLVKPKRTSRTPFTRARTQFDSPMDIQMAEPSPMSINCLSLSPRRTALAAASGVHSSKNIFARVAAQKDAAKLLNPMRLPPSSPSSLGVTLEDEEDCIPDLPSPTRNPAAQQEPFKIPSRPGLSRQKTAPTHRLNSNPDLFRTRSKPVGRVPSPTHSTTASGSPVRKAPTKNLSAGDNDMHKAVMQRNLLGNGCGRTLVELAQARGIPAVKPREKEGSGEREREPPPTWDPERDEMPSPFLIRGGKGLRGL